MENCVVETGDLTKRYGEREAVSGLNLRVRAGRVYGLIGRNGAGKTTALKLLLGLIEPTRGDVFLFGERLWGHERAALARTGSLIGLPGFYPNLTGSQNLRLFARLRGAPREAVWRALGVVGLPDGDGKLFSQYSPGMKRRLAIALAILGDPELLILDDPFDGLDPDGIAATRAFIRMRCRERGMTALVTGRIPSDIATLADDVGILEGGRLLEEESMDELRERRLRYARLVVSDARRAAELAGAVFYVRAQAEDAHTLRLPGMLCPPGAPCPPGTPCPPGGGQNMEELVRLLVENDVGVREARVCEETPEDYFRRMTGGGGVA